MLLSTLLFVLTPTLDVPWRFDVDAGALGEARERDVHVMVYFFSNGSERCRQMYEETLQNEAVESMLRELVPVSADVMSETGGRLLKEHGVTTLPTLLFLDGEGEAVDIVLGYAPPEAFLHEVARIRSGEGTLPSLREQLDAHEPGSNEDLEARLALAVKLKDLGRKEEAERIRASARAADPEGATDVGARLLIDEQWEALAYDEQGEPVEAAERELDSLYKLVKKSKHAPVRYHGWSALARLEVDAGRLDKARKAMDKAVPSVPADAYVGWSQEMVWTLIEAPVETSSKDRKFAIELASAAVEHSEKTRPEDAAEPEYGEQPSKACTIWRKQHASGLDTLAWALWNDGKLEDAIELAERCCELDPENKEYPTRAATFQEPRAS